MPDFSFWGRALAVMLGSSAVVATGTVVGAYSITKVIVRSIRKA